VARTEQQIQLDLGRPLDGNEDGLVNYFAFDQLLTPDLNDRGPGGATATITGDVENDSGSAVAGTRYT
jgi:hypothetical protein